MTTRRRNILIYSLGVALTLTVIVLDQTDSLVGVERLFGDTRAATCQFFTPAPSTQLVHLDIDDASLEAGGKWPWPRKTQAAIVDEVRRAGGKVLGLDIVYPDPEPEGDPALAAALAEFGGALVPTSYDVDPVPEPPAVQMAAEALLREDLELTWEDASARLAGERPDLPPLSEREFITARSDAARFRVEQELARGNHDEHEEGDGRLVDALARRLLPRAAASRAALPATLLRLVEQHYRRYESDQALERFGRPVPEGLEYLVRANDQRIPLLPVFGRASAYGGFVDLIRPSADESAVRAVPLWIEYRGRLFPQMGLSVACAALGVDPADIELRNDGMRIPLPDGDAIDVPLRTAKTSRGYGAMFFDLPWFGTEDWETMYDHPRHVDWAQHVPMALAWAVAQGRDTLVSNNGQADRAMRYIGTEVGYSEAAAAFVAAPTPPDETERRMKAVGATLADLDALGGIGDGLGEDGQPRPDLDPVQTAYVQAYLDLQSALAVHEQQHATFVRNERRLRQLLEGKYILVGFAATGAMDKYPTPLHSECPGVVVHGLIFNAIMTRDFWRTAPRWVTLLITLVAGLSATLIVARLSPYAAMVWMLLLTGGYLLLNGLFLFDYNNVLVGVSGPVLAGGVVWSGLTLTRFIAEAAERNRITRKFRSYVDPNLVNYVLEHPEKIQLEGEFREMTVVFTDLAGFTPLTEKLKEKAVPILKDYMSRMVPVIKSHDGLLNKFLGDGIMFFFGAPKPKPDHAAAAVATVLEMRKELEKLNAELAAAGHPTLSMRAGVSTGNMVVGDAGPEARSEYTVLGDVVNTGARLEAANKALGTHILLTGRTAELIRDKFIVRPVGRLLVPGKKEAVEVYEPIAPVDAATEEQRRLAELSRSVFEHYTAGRFDDCLQTLSQVELSFGESKLTTVYRDLCSSRRNEPTDGFDGAITVRDK